MRVTQESGFTQFIIFKFSNMYKIGLILALVMLTTSCNDCLYHAKQFEKRQFEMIIKKKYIKYGKQTDFEGVDLNGNRALFDEVGFWELYDMAEIGDTMRKELGTSNIKLCRKDTCLVYRWECDGRRVD